MTDRVREHEPSSDIRRTAAVAADYTQLQGLINVSTGVGLVLIAFGQQSLGAIVVAAGVAVWGTYYQRRFGRVVGRGSWVGSLAVVLVALVVCLAGFTVDGLLRGPVLVLPLLAAVCFAVGYRIGYRHVGVTAAHWVAVGVLVVGAFAPLLGLGMLGARTGVLLLGVAMVIVGLADHARLVRTMKPVPRD